MDEIIANFQGVKSDKGGWEFPSDHLCSAAFMKITEAFPDIQFDYIGHRLWIG